MPTSLPPTKEEMLVTVRTYPTPSTSHREVVCTGAVTLRSEWRRLYPVPLRYLPEECRFKTWDVIRLNVKPSKSDRRVESRRPHLPTLEVVRHVQSWQARNDWIRSTIVQSMAELRSQQRTLAPVRVKEVLDLTAHPVNAEWEPKKRAALNASSLFDTPIPLEKIPYEFRIEWRDGDGELHDSLMISWETAQTWRRYRGKYDNPIEVMKDKLVADLFSPSRDVSFFMGNHSRFRDTFMLCGWFVPPKGDVADGQLFL